VIACSHLVPIVSGWLGVIPKLSGQAPTKAVYTFEDQQRQKMIGLSSFGWWKKTPTEVCYFFGTPAKAEKNKVAIHNNHLPVGDTYKTAFHKKINYTVEE